MHWDVKSVQPLADHRLYLDLEDGRTGLFDLKPYLDHGMFRELKGVHYFKEVGVVMGALTWPNEQGIAPETLVAGLQPLEA